MIAKQPRWTSNGEHRGASKDGKVGRTWTLDVHEVRVWRLHKSLELVTFFFGFLGGVEKIDGERLVTKALAHHYRSGYCGRCLP